MTEKSVPAEVIDYLASPRGLAGGDVLDVLEGMDYDQAYLAQFLSKERQAGANGPIIGYQASLTSAAAKTLGPPDMPKPYFGTLQLRNWHDPAVPISIAGRTFVIECETGFRLASSLKGPGVTPQAARRAVASAHAAVEIVPIGPGIMGRSGQHMVAVHNFGSYVAFGDRIGDGESALASEPVELFCDGVTLASAVAGDSGGDPFAVLAEMANIVGAYGKVLEAGMVIMTGSCTPPTRLPQGARRIEARFGGLGRVVVQFDD